MIRSAWRIWKRFRWKNLVRVWAVFMAIALVLLAQTLGIHYGATKFTLKYMARNEAIPAQNAIMGQRATNLMLVDSSQDGVDEAEAMMKQVLLDMKVPTATVDLAKTDPDDIPSLNRYRTVLIVMPELDSLGDELVSIMRWVEGGGNMMLAMTPEKTGYLDAIGPQIGIESSAYDYVMTKGIKPARDFMLGGGHTYMFSGPFKSSLSLNLNEKATVEAVSANGHTPLIWSADVRSGRTVTCNIGIYGKVVRGFYASAFSLLGSATAYPVINSAAFYLDDFPSPVPSGDATYIKRDYGMSIADFYSRCAAPRRCRHRPHRIPARKAVCCRLAGRCWRWCGFRARLVRLSAVLPWTGCWTAAHIPTLWPPAARTFGMRSARAARRRQLCDSATDGTRIGMVGDYMRLAAESELNMHFVSTHFMHPDDMLDPDRGAKEGRCSEVRAADGCSHGSRFRRSV